jgi:hypothetical protein
MLRSVPVGRREARALNIGKMIEWRATYSSAAAL